MGPAIRIKIRSDWDSALTYDSLDRPSDRPGAPEAVFVGRKDLLEPLVAAIRQPGQRGTYLISGYRGTGKTTLVIEALRRAQAQLTEGWHLFPLILNVSEVSASLETSKPQGESSLRIDPRRLLVALLRALEHRSDLLGQSAQDSAKELRRLVQDVYRKAVAKEYSLSLKARKEVSRAAVRETSLELKAADLYKAVTGLSALTAGALEAVALLGPALKSLHAVALALAGVSAASFAISRKVTTKHSTAREAEESLKFDNSLHQLENDLRDILSRLHSAKLRTVVVLEELDKIRDDTGDQLDGVIRYFKNLFTQAPALFFFLTDKAYFDLISSKIKKARRQRSYAVEHTFFTHRVFVGRPTTRDCLDYLREVVLDPDQQARLAATYTTAEPKAKSLQEMDAFARFVRVLLFRAANHLFDLKNEVRHFVRAGATQAQPDVELVIDDSSLPEDQAAVAVLQDRVEEKAGSFALASGRAYANEVLHDCLYAVFNELGSTKPQRIADFYPSSGREELQNQAPAGGRGAQDKVRPSGQQGRDHPMPAELLLDEQLEWNEVERIKDAVKSLVEDLQRGGALDAEKTDFAKGEFTWKQNAARVFRYVRKLEKHEEDLVATLRRLSAAAAAFKPGAALGWLAPNAQDAAVLVDQLDQRAKDLQGADTPLPVERALEEAEQLRSQVALVPAAAYTRQLERLGALYGVQTPLLVAPTSHGGGLLQVQTTWGDPRSMTALRQGVVLLAQGDGDRLDDDLREFVERSHNLERLSLIHVIHVPGDPLGPEASRLTWVTKPGGLKVAAVTMEVLPLDEGLAATDMEDRWGERLGRELLFRSYWAAQPRSFAAFPDGPHAVAGDDPEVKTHQGAQPETEARSLSLSAAVEFWLQSSDRVLRLRPGISLDTHLDVVRVLSRPQFTNVAAIWAVSASSRGELLQKLGDEIFNRSGLLGWPPTPNHRRGAAVEQLISAGVLILALNIDPPTVATGPPALTPEVFRETLGDRGRGILFADDVPPSLSGLGVTYLERP